MGALGTAAQVDCVEVETCEAERDSEDPCSWALIITVLRDQLAGLPPNERGDLEDFIELLEGIAALGEG